MTELEKKVQETAINAIMFAVRNNFLNEAIGIEFDKGRTTCYMTKYRCINMNLEQLDCDYYLNEMVSITSKGDEEILERFTDEEICLFHELGHAIDIDLQKYSNDDLKEIIEIREDAELIARSEFHKLDLFQEVSEDTLDIVDNALSTTFYRSLPLELEADEIAYLIMKYIVEHGFELEDFQ